MKFCVQFSADSLDVTSAAEELLRVRRLELEAVPALDVASAELVTAVDELLRPWRLELEAVPALDVASAELVTAVDELLRPWRLELEAVPALDVASAELVTAVDELLRPWRLELEMSVLSLELDLSFDALETISSVLELLPSSEELEEESSQALNAVNASAVPMNKTSFFLFIIPAFVW